MGELIHFGLIVLVLSAGFALAVLAQPGRAAGPLPRLAGPVPIPSPAIFLLAAAIAAQIFPRLGSELSIRDVERIAVLALIVILFDGGMRVGWARFRGAVVPSRPLGVLAPFAPAGLMTLAGRYLFDFSWTGAGILGAALAPTD